MDKLIVTGKFIDNKMLDRFVTLLNLALELLENDFNCKKDLNERDLIDKKLEYCLDLLNDLDNSPDIKAFLKDKKDGKIVRPEFGTK